MFLLYTKLSFYSTSHYKASSDIVSDQCNVAVEHKVHTAIGYKL